MVPYIWLNHNQYWFNELVVTRCCTHLAHPLHHRYNESALMLILAMSCQSISSLTHGADGVAAIVNLLPMFRTTNVAMYHSMFSLFHVHLRTVQFSLHSCPFALFAHLNRSIVFHRQSIPNRFIFSYLFKLDYFSWYKWKCTQTHTHIHTHIDTHT